MRKVLLLAMLIASVATFAEDASTGKLTIYRVHGAIHRAAKLPVYVDDQKIAQLKNGSFLTLALPAGRHVVRMKERYVAALPVEIRPNSETYLRIILHDPFWQLQAVPAEQAEVDMKKVKPLDPH